MPGRIPSAPKSRDDGRRRCSCTRLLPSGGGQVAVQWRKRRWRCRTKFRRLQTFTEQVAQVPAGMRTTTRLRAALAWAVEDGRDQSEVAAAHQVSWPTVQRAVIVHGAVELVEPEPVRVLGMDETRFGRPRWLPDGVHDDGRIRGSAPIRGRPGSSTSPATRPCWGRSTAAPARRCGRGWWLARPSSGPGCGPGAASIRRNETPLRASSQASVSSVGPAPTISTVGAFRTCGESFVLIVSVISSLVQERDSCWADVVSPNCVGPGSARRAGCQVRLSGVLNPGRAR